MIYRFLNTGKKMTQKRTYSLSVQFYTYSQNIHLVTFSQILPEQAKFYYPHFTDQSLSHTCFLWKQLTLF